jgi:hypothetical protein
MSNLASNKRRHMCRYQSSPFSFAKTSPADPEEVSASRRYSMTAFGFHHGRICPVPVRFLRALSHDTIRLLILEPEAGDQDISCALFAVRLSCNPDFVALSYVWGPPDEGHLIWLNHKPLKFRRNLWHCLWRSCNITQPMCLCFDAISVSQENLRERTHQAGFMSQIYSNARQVISWSGGTRMALRSSWRRLHRETILPNFPETASLATGCYRPHL